MDCFCGPSRSCAGRGTGTVRSWTLSHPPGYPSGCDSADSVLRSRLKLVGDFVKASRLQLGIVLTHDSLDMVTDS